MRRAAFGAMTAVSLAGLLGLAPGCGGQAASVCSLICECEHCNDYEEDLTCIQVETSLEIAEAYDCAAEWEALATCYEDKGKCDEKEARFGTRTEGSCSGSGVCNGNSNIQCTFDEECPSGEDRCDNEQEDLGECQSKASDDPQLGSQQGG